MRTMIFVLTSYLLIFYKTYAQQEIIPFASARWDKENAKQSEFLGRECLIGKAVLKDVEFTNGIIEFDLAVNGERSYPGIIFRALGDKEYERIYLRPHLSKVFQNVVQYEGTFNGLDSWQLYYGPGKTASATFPLNEWFHVKIEVMDTQARLFISDMEKPVLAITALAHGISKGNLGVWAPLDGSAYFSRFSYRTDNALKFPAVPEPDNPLGIITGWEISQPGKLSDADMEILPGAEELKNIKWQKVQSLPSGLVDISRYHGRSGQTPDIIRARTEIVSGKEETKQFAFGYSDMISIFLNGKILFSGNSQYMSRDGNFQGIVGLNDYIFLPLKKGKNELMIAVAETFGGWGFMFQDVNAIYEQPGMVKRWELKNKFRYPESVVYDQKRDVLYVSNFTFERDGFISKVKMDGEIEEINWIPGILQPAGLCIRNDKLYIVGRFNLVEYDLEKDAVTSRYPFPQPVFPNDVTCDEAGTVYVTDGAKTSIFKLENGKFSEWIHSDQLAGANGILLQKGKLFVGTSHDGSIRAIDLNTREISTLFTFGVQTVMDGLAGDGNGNFLLSDHAGRLFRITQTGEKELLLNTESRQINIADFEFIPEKKLLVIPTLEDNRVMVYSVK